MIDAAPSNEKLGYPRPAWRAMVAPHHCGSEGVASWWCDVTDSAMKFQSVRVLSRQEDSSSDFENGNGYYVERHDNKYTQSDTNAILKAGDRVIMCESGTTDDKLLKPADACKTLRGM